MTSFKQLDANRRNALQSTGPRTEAGKRRSRRNAVRHGLTAETVIEPLEQATDYIAFEMSVAADFDPQTAVERELVLRLASLLWRLRRATSIETGLLQLQLEEGTKSAKQQMGLWTSHVLLWVDKIASARSGGDVARPTPKSDADDNLASSMAGLLWPNQNTKLALTFQRAADSEQGVFVRLNRYESGLWRQVAQTLFMLNFLRRPARKQNAFPAMTWHDRSESPHEPSDFFRPKRMAGEV